MLKKPALAALALLLPHPRPFLRSRRPSSTVDPLRPLAPMLLTTYLADVLTTTVEHPEAQRCTVRCARVTVPGERGRPGYPFDVGPFASWLTTDGQAFLPNGQDDNVFASSPGTGVRLLPDTVIDDPAWNAWPVLRALLRGEYDDVLNRFDRMTAEARCAAVARPHPDAGTLLHMAVSLDFTVLVDRLLAHGADPHVQMPEDSPGPFAGQSALDLAAHANRLRLANGGATLNALLRAGADLNRAQPNGSALDRMADPEDGMDHGHPVQFWSRAELIAMQVTAEAQRLREAMGTLGTGTPSPVPGNRRRL